MARKSRNGSKNAEAGPKFAAPSEHAAQSNTSLQLAVTWLSGLLLLSVVAYLVWEGTLTPEPASFDAQILEVTESAGRHYARLLVVNGGDESVQSLSVTLELLEGEEVVESSSVVLDWLPESSTRELVVILEHDPRGFEPRVAFGGYQVP